MKSQSLKDILVLEVIRRIVEESIPRIKQCLGLLDENEVWYKHNPNLNSPGVLILHLCGNVRQWILSGVCGLADNRQREAEFHPEIQPTKVELTAILDSLSDDLILHLPRISEEVLTEIRQVQCFEEPVLSMLIHAVEHFSYHTGQIVYYTKWIKNVDTGFYTGMDLTRKASENTATGNPQPED